MKKYAILAISLVCFIGFFVWFGTKEFNLQNVNSIVLQDGSTGEFVTLNDKDTINTIVNSFNDMSFKKDKSSKNYTGWAYRITFKDTNGNTIEDIVIMNDTRIKYSNYFYDATKGTINVEFIKTQIKK